MFTSSAINFRSQRLIHEFFVTSHFMGINPKNHSVKKLLNIVDFLVVNGPKLASCYRQINSFSFANCCAMFAEHNEQ